MKSFPSWLPRLCVVALVLVAVSGCGLSDYQSRMDAQRARLQRFDEVNSLLGDPIEMPTFLDKSEPKPAWPFDFYLRLPKNFALHRTPYSTNFPFYRYYSHEPDCNFFIAAALIAPPKGKESPGTYTLENFRGYVRHGIDDYYFKNYKADPKFFLNKAKLFLPADKIRYETVEEATFSPFSDVTAKIPFSCVTFKDTANKAHNEHSEFRCSFHESANKQIAIVVQFPLREPPYDAFDKSIKAALSTLDISPEAASKREKYKKVKGI